MNAPAEDLPSRWSIRICLALLVSLHLYVGVSLVTMELLSPHYLLYSDIFVTQPGLLAIAIALPQGAKRFRLALAALSAPLCLILAWPTDMLVLGRYVPFYFGTTLTCCLLIRRAGFTIRAVGRAERAELPAMLRFSIAQIMLATTILGILLAINSWINRTDPYVVDAPVELLKLAQNVVEVLINLSIALLSLWAALGGPWWTVRTAIAAVCLATLMTIHIWPFREDVFPLIGAGYLTQVLLFFLPLLSIRACGYRLVQSSSTVGIQPEPPN